MKCTGYKGLLTLPSYQVSLPEFYRINFWLDTQTWAGHRKTSKGITLPPTTNDRLLKIVDNCYCANCANLLVQDCNRCPVSYLWQEIIVDWAGGREKAMQLLLHWLLSCNTLILRNCSYLSENYGRKSTFGSCCIQRRETCAAPEKKRLLHS